MAHAIENLQMNLKYTPTLIEGELQLKRGESTFVGVVNFSAFSFCRLNSLRTPGRVGKATGFAALWAR